MTVRQVVSVFAVVLVVALFAVACDAQGARSTHRQVCQVFGKRCAAAWRVVRCETGGTFDRWAWSPTGDAGLFQANYAAHHRAGESVASFRRRHANVAWHIRWAFRLSHGGRDWSAWTCQP